MYILLPVSLDFPFFIVPSVFSLRLFVTLQTSKLEIVLEVCNDKITFSHLRSNICYSNSGLIKCLAIKEEINTGDIK